MSYMALWRKTVLARVSTTAVMKHHDQKEPGKNGLILLTLPHHCSPLREPGQELRLAGTWRQQLTQRPGRGLLAGLLTGRQPLQLESLTAGATGGCETLSMLGTEPRHQAHTQCTHIQAGTHTHKIKRIFKNKRNQSLKKKKTDKKYCITVPAAQVVKESCSQEGHEGQSHTLRTAKWRTREP